MVTRTDTDYKRAIGVLKTRRETEQALYQLRDRGIDLEQVSVIAPDSDPKSKDADVDVYTHSQGNHADSGAVGGAIAGGALGTITGLLVGLGAIAIPGVGPILLAGAEATALATTLAGTAIGATSGGIIGALVGLGVPEDQAKVYNERLSQGQYLVIVTGTPRTVGQAEDILHDQGIEELHVYDALQVEVTPTMDNMVSPSTLKREENIATSNRVVHQEHPELIEREKRTTVTPKAETELFVKSTADRRENLNNIDRDRVSTNPEVIVIDKRDEKYKKS
ncbi:hypothetical protein [Lyngbya sp. PCC 8106]|uniref:hypothetical protein n=1 Tax=Lyngbya sp. (strain PCC 8106) TaxID=313612 RepID=UPI0002F7F462|nr:hypothetical protein [Lyngbya sp. PCC 8106]